MKKVMIFSMVLLVFPYLETQGQAQGKLYAGLGAGLSYGGFGAQLSYHPIEIVSLFGSLGYNLNSIGYNFGAQSIFPSSKRINFHITGMYGYNAVLVVKGNVTSKTTYYGLSVGGGLTLKSKATGRSYWSFEILLPFRPKAYHDAIRDLKLIGYDVKEPLPVAFSFGYHYNIRLVNKNDL